MRRRFLAISALLSLFSSTVVLASWRPVGEGKEKIGIDPARIARVGDGLVAVWSRLELPQAVDDTEGRYDAIEALNRYDCVRRRFTTLKRLYLRDQALVRAESVLAPREVAVPAAGLEARIVADVCKGTEAATVSNQPAPAAPEAGPRMMTVAAPAAAAATPAAQPLHRFIILPQIDPSMVEHPTDEPPPDTAKKPDAKRPAAKPDEKKSPTEIARAVRSEAEKAGVKLDTLKGMDKRAREVALATSGPPRAKARAELVKKDIRWSYAGDGAPSHWGKLRDDFATCDRGQRQSPIDIRDGIRVDMEPIAFDYQPGRFRITDTGNTIQVTPAEGSTMSVMGRTYRLTQIHFHHPGEERVDGRGYEMSMHLEHRDEHGNVAIVAVVIERGEEQPAIQTFWNNLPLETNSELAPATPIDPAQLLPQGRDYYAYMGSLTTPPCTEGVLWLVMKQPLRLSAEQIAIFARLYPNNARPLQAANGRLIKESR